MHKYLETSSGRRGKEEDVRGLLSGGGFWGVCNSMHAKGNVRPALAFNKGDSEQKLAAFARFVIKSHNRFTF